MRDIVPASNVGEFDQNATFSSVYGIVVTVLSGLGIILTLIFFVVLLVTYPYRGGTTVLGFLLLFGLMLLYACNFAFIILPNQDDGVICGIRRFGLGFVYALCFACLLVKVVNNWREAGYTEAQDHGGVEHPCSFFLIAIGLTMVQVIIGVEWLILRPPNVIPAAEMVENTLVCVPVDFHHKELVLSCTYVMLLIFCTLVFAALSWDSDDNNHESRWILVCAVCTSGVFLVWTIISTLTDVMFRDPSIVIANLVIATIILICMYFTKIFRWRRFKKEEKAASRYSSGTIVKGKQ